MTRSGLETINIGAPNTSKALRLISWSTRGTVSLFAALEHGAEGITEPLDSDALRVGRYSASSISDCSRSSGLARPGRPISSSNGSALSAATPKKKKSAL